MLIRLLSLALSPVVCLKSGAGTSEVSPCQPNPGGPPQPCRVHLGPWGCWTGCWGWHCGVLGENKGFGGQMGLAGVFFAGVRGGLLQSCSSLDAGLKQLWSDGEQADSPSCSWKPFVFEASRVLAGIQCEGKVGSARWEPLGAPRAPAERAPARGSYGAPLSLREFRAPEQPKRRWPLGPCPPPRVR